MVSVAICLVLPLPRLKSTMSLPMWDILVLVLLARRTVFVGVLVLWVEHYWFIILVQMGVLNIDGEDLLFIPRSVGS